MSLKSSISDQGFAVIKLPSDSIINDITKIVDKESNKLLKIYSTDEYHKKLIEIQTRINLIGTRDKLLSELADVLYEFHGSEEFGAQTVVYLRGVRPVNKESSIKHEALPMHRENFYCDEEYIDYQLNMHFPISNYNENTSMKYYRNSHNIPDQDLIIDKKDHEYSGIKRFSRGHQLGLPYNPKIIENLNDMDFPLSAPCTVNDAFLFSSKLIHGGGLNFTDKIRFSLDFATLPKKWLSTLKSNHFASYEKNKSHFVEVSVKNHLVQQ